MKKVICFIIAIVMTTTMLASDVQAAAVKRGPYEQIMAAYYTLLSQKTTKWSGRDISTKDIEYDFCDINKDGVPELTLLYNWASHADGWERIYTYVGGKAKSIGRFTSIEISRNKNFFMDSYANCGMTENDYYRLKNGKKVSLASYETSDVYPEDVKASEITKKTYNGYPIYYFGCKVGGKKTTYAKCMEYIRDLEKGAKYEHLDYRENEYANQRVTSTEKREKYKGNTFYTGYVEDDCYPNVYKVYKSGTRRMLQYDAHIVRSRGKYLYTEKNHGDWGPSTLCVINKNTHNIRCITTKFVEDAIEANSTHAYYATYLKNYDDPQKAKIKIYRCKLDGTGRKAMTKAIRADWVVKVTAKYVRYKKGSKEYRYYYSSKKVERVYS